MKKEDLDFLRAQLEDERRKILSNANQTLKNDLELSSDEMADENDLASALYDQGFTLRLRDRERLLMVKIQRALKRINEGEYGYCEVCDDEIGFQRLKARPVATLCIECKEESERSERSFAKSVKQRIVPRAVSRAGDTTSEGEPLGLDKIAGEADESRELDLGAEAGVFE